MLNRYESILPDNGVRTAAISQNNLAAIVIASTLRLFTEFLHSFYEPINTIESDIGHLGFNYFFLALVDDLFYLFKALLRLLFIFLS